MTNKFPQCWLRTLSTKHLTRAQRTPQTKEGSAFPPHFLSISSRDSKTTGKTHLSSQTY